MIKISLNSCKLLLLAILLFSCVKDFEQIPANTVLIGSTRTSLKTGVVLMDDAPSTTREGMTPLFFHRVMLLSDGFTINSQNVLGTGSGIVVTIASDKPNIKAGKYAFNPHTSEPNASDLLQAVLLDNYNLGTESGDRRETLTEGYLKISKSGEDYVIVFEGTIDGDHVEVHYSGAVNLIDTAPSGYCRIHQISYSTNSEQLYVTTYFYDAYGRLTGSLRNTGTASTPAIYHYDNGFVDFKTTMHNPYAETYEAWTYRDKLLSEISGSVFVNYDNESNYWHAFLYIGSTLAGTSSSWSEGDVNGGSDEYMYHGDNVVSYSSRFSDATEEYTTLSGYDFKKNPYRLLATAVGQPLFVEDAVLIPRRLSKNNPSRLLRASGWSEEYKYEYNEQGYPTKLKITVFFGDVISTVQEYAFTYEGCE